MWKGLSIILVAIVLSLGANIVRMKEITDQHDAPLNYGKLVPLLKESKLPDTVLVASETHQMIVIFSRHKHYRHLEITLASVDRTKNGKPKNPIQLLDPLDLVWRTEEPAELKFFSGIAKFKHKYSESSVASDLEALKAIIYNPLQLDFYQHDEKNFSSLTALSLLPIKLSFLKADIEIDVNEKAGNYQIDGRLYLNQKAYAIADLQLRFHYFVEIRKHLYLIDLSHVLQLIDFFKQNQNSLQLSSLAYEEFQTTILSKLAAKIKINYAYLKKASQAQRIEQGFDLPNEQLIYLSESADFILLTPVMKYGGLEIPVISQQQIRAKDKRGKFFTLARAEEKELQFITFIAKMHPYFAQQVIDFSDQRHADCFYIHKKYFLSPDWFLAAFEAWRSRGIAILGFNELKNNKFSPFKAEISIQVVSGIDWFETAIKVKFNKETVSLKHLHKSIRNKSKFVQLDDGTIGILPDEWLSKFEQYFGAAEIVGEVLHTPNINYTLIAELYEQEVLHSSARQRLEDYRLKFDAFETISTVSVPKALKASLRPYQREGLNWLNFLDEFNFGGCLADDMGLGKTVQVLAFILSQIEKGKQQANLIVVPASLIFNWQEEINKFAPTLKTSILHGNQQSRQAINFAAFDVVITTYGTLLSAISTLKEHYFNYIFLDESQYIKNPDSQRYKAARLLQSRNKIVLTGTPIENSTFDLYGQFSFACPGLLGSREQFKRLYAVPIDQFKVSKRSEDLQRRINPFLLRRTKDQVASELPVKTEMVIYCEMGSQQREIYDSCRNEIRDYLMGTAEDELAKSSMHVLHGITKLRQICISPALLDQEKYFGNASAKMEVLMEQIESKAPEHKLLVFSQFVQMLDLVKVELEKRKIAFTYLSGQTKNRSAVVDAFQNDNQVRVFLISLKAGGVGLNLTKADYVYLIDPWWNPAVENQAIDRAHRIGQEQHVMAVRLICPDTIEEKIMRMQESKKDLVSNLIKTDTSIFKSLSKKQLLELI